MEIRVLRYFLTVCREENITRAADALHVTQPTLSRQMVQLEKELGTVLFIRGKRLILTDAGLKLRSRIEEVVQIMEKVENELKGQEEIKGVISVGTGGLASFQTVASAAESFRKKYPQVQFEFYTNNAEFIKERLDRGLLDFGLLLEPIDVTKYDYLRMAEKERWGVFMRKDNKLASKKAITRADLLATPLITSNRLAIQKELNNWLQCDMQDLNIVATYNIITNVVTMVEKEMACALTIEGAVEAFEGTNLTFRPLKPALDMTSVLVWKKFNPFFNAAGKFLEHFKSMQNEHTIE